MSVIKPVVLVLILISTACGTYNKQEYYKPVKTVKWDKDGYRHFKNSCSDKDIKVSSFILDSRHDSDSLLWLPVPSNNNKTFLQNGPFLVIQLFSKPRITNCPLSAISFVSEGSKSRIRARKVEKYFYNDDSSPKQRTDCTYYFRPYKKSYHNLTLNISKELLGCHIENINYKYKETNEYIPRY